MLTKTIRRADQSILGSLLNWVKDAISRRRALSRMNRCEMEAVARDLNMSVTELAALILTSPESLELLRKRFAYAKLSEKYCPNELLLRSLALPLETCRPVRSFDSSAKCS